MVSREKDAFGGMKFGSCFFGWLTASGTAVLLAAVVTGVGAALGLSRDVEAATTSATETESVGLVGGILLVAIIFVAYLAGGTGGRMRDSRSSKALVSGSAVIMAILLPLPAVVTNDSTPSSVNTHRGSQ